MYSDSAIPYRKIGICSSLRQPISPFESVYDTISVMKILLTGATGLLGRALRKHLLKMPNVELAAAAYSRAAPPLVKTDLTDTNQVNALFQTVRPDIVIHAAAERRPDIVDSQPDKARALNVVATENIAMACARHAASLLYISTDYVFDGSNPPYFPNSPVNPLNEYGRLKLEGERRIKEICPHGAILRIPLLYGPVEYLEECSVTELAKKLLGTTAVKVEHWAQRYPLHVDDVSRAITAITRAMLNFTEPFPIFLLSGPTPYTKYEMLLEMGRVLGKSTSHIMPDTAPPAGAPRPKDCRMDTSLIESLGYVPQIEFGDGIKSALLPYFSEGV